MLVHTSFDRFRFMLGNVRGLFLFKRNEKKNMFEFDKCFNYICIIDLVAEVWNIWICGIWDIWYLDCVIKWNPNNYYLFSKILQSCLLLYFISWKTKKKFCQPCKIFIRIAHFTRAIATCVNVPIYLCATHSIVFVVWQFPRNNLKSLTFLELWWTCQF